MCASTIDNDYVHILASKITKIIKNKKLYFNIKNIADFERNFETFNYNLIREELNQRKYNLVIFQLGDNIDNNKSKKIVKYYQTLINIVNDKDKNIIKIITVPFFCSKEKEKMTKIVAKSTNSFIVDLGIISKLNCSKAYYDNPYQNEGINNHPGDFGMQIIANEIFAKIKDIICIAT